MNPFRFKLNQTARRAIVVVMYAVAALVVAYWASLAGDPSAQQLSAALSLSIVGGVIFHLGFWLLYLTTKQLADRSNRAVDERELTLRNRAHFLAYWILGFVVGFVWFVPLPDIGGVFWKAVAFLAFFSVYGSLPTAIVAWLEPDPVSEDTPAPLHKEPA